MFEDFKSNVHKKARNQLGSIAIKDPILRSEAARAEEAFRENNGLPVLDDCSTTLTEKQIIAKTVLTEGWY